MQPPSDQQPAAPAPGWQYSPEQPAHDITPGKQISWTASEFIAHQKNVGWYALLAGGAVVLATAVYLVTHDVISAVIVMIVAVMMGAYAGRKPRTLQYQLDAQGIHIGQKNLSFAEFKSFSVIEEGAMASIRLTPLKRFMPSVSIYYDPHDEKYITDILADYLPYVEGQKDAVDKLMHKIRF